MAHGYGLGPSKHGTRFYRPVIGDAKDAADFGLNDEDIIGEEGFESKTEAAQQKG